jgi:hypothetical protein
MIKMIDRIDQIKQDKDLSANDKVSVDQISIDQYFLKKKLTKEKYKEYQYYKYLPFLIYETDQSLDLTEDQTSIDHI